MSDGEGDQLFSPGRYTFLPLVHCLAVGLEVWWLDHRNVRAIPHFSHIIPSILFSRDVELLNVVSSNCVPGR